MQRTRDQLLACTRLTGDENGRIGRGNAAYLFEHRFQARTLTDDFLEVVLRLDLFLQVQILLLQSCSSALRRALLGDTPPEGAGAGPPARRIAELFHQNARMKRPAVLAAKLALNARQVVAGEKRLI